MSSMAGGKGLVYFIVLTSFVRTSMHSVLDWSFVNKCDRVEVPSVSNFDAQKYMGTWYEQKHVKEFEIFQPADAKCIKAEYSDLKNGKFIVKNSFQTPVGNEISTPDTWFNKIFYNWYMGWPADTVAQNGLNGRLGVIGSGQCDSGTADCYVSFFGFPVRTPNYKVIDTDYDSYSVVYGCNRWTQIQTVWILTRKTYIPSYDMRPILASLQAKVPSFKQSSHFQSTTY